MAELQFPNFGASIINAYGAGVEQKNARIKQQRDEQALQLEQNKLAAFQRYAPDLLSNDPQKQNAAVSGIGSVDPSTALDWKQKLATLSKEERAAQREQATLSAQELGGILALPDDQFLAAASQKASTLPQADAAPILDAINRGDVPMVRAYADAYRRAHMTVAEQAGRDDAAATQKDREADNTRADRQATDAERHNRALENAAARRAAAAEASAANAGNGAGGPFKGNGLDAQAYNMILTGDPLSTQYAMAYAHLAQPKTYFDSASGQLVRVPPMDLSSVPKPGQPRSAAPTQMQQGAAQVASNPQQNDPTKISVQQVAPAHANQDQNLNAGFAARLDESNAILNKLEDESASFVGNLKAKVPLGLGNYFQGSDYQKVDQAKRNFINAQLRRESGATIQPDEFDNANKQYFPMPGDKPEVIAQKRRNREVAVKNMRRMAGPAAPKPSATGTASIQDLVNEARKRGLVK